MAQVPSNLIPTTVTQLPEAPVASEDSLMMIVYQGNNYKIRVGDLLSVAGVPTSRQVIAGTGLQGGGQLTENVTLSIAPGGVGSSQLAASGVTPGSYGDGTTIPVFTVDETGRVVAATSIPVTLSGYVPDSREVIAGAGLSGGGQLTGDVTLDANLSNATPQPTFQAGSAGTSDNISRADHKHPAINLGVDDEVDGILKLNNGGTARSIVPDAGAIIWCGADGLYVGPVGVAGQVLFSGGTGAYLWVNESDMDVDSAARVRGGAANQILFQSASGVTAFITAPTSTNTVLNWTGTTFNWVPQTGGGGGGSGTVTSVDASGGTTGMTFSGVPIVTSGTMTLGGTLVVGSGGTGATDATTARSNLSAAKSGANSDITSMSGLTGGVGSPTYVDMGNGSAVSLAAGRMWYNPTTGSWNLGMGGGNITQQVGEEFFVYGKASTAITDSPLKIVYKTGTVGGSGVITFAPTVSGITDGDLIIGVATENIALNGFGRVTSDGVVNAITTDGSAYGETWADGDVIWYNPVTGNPTKNKPSAPNIKVSVGVIIKAGSGGSGSIQVEINHGSVLGGTDSNVQLTSVADTQLLQYYGVGGYWRNVNPSTVSVGSATNVTGTVAIGNGGTGQITQQAAINALAGAVTSAQFLRGNGTNVVMSTIQVSDVPTLNQNTTGSAGSVANSATFNSLGAGDASPVTYNGSAARTISYNTVGAPSVTGTNASGTWSISINGNAATATTATSATSATSATTATNIAGGVASQLHYQSAPNTTAFVANGTAGQVLLSAGTGAPAFGNVSGGTF